MLNKNLRLFFYYYLEHLFLTIVFGSFIFGGLVFKNSNQMLLKNISYISINLFICYNLAGYIIAITFYYFMKKDEFFFFYNNGYSKKYLNITSFICNLMISISILMVIKYAIL